MATNQKRCACCGKSYEPGNQTGDTYIVMLGDLLQQAKDNYETALQAAFNDKGMHPDDDVCRDCWRTEVIPALRRVVSKMNQPELG